MMSDLISRQAAMVVFENSGLDDDSKDTVVRVLEQLPSAHPTYTDEEIQKMQDLESAEIEKAYQLGYEDGKVKPHWIPCSERLPEDNVPVNITWINRKPEFYYAEIKDVPFTATGVYFKGKWYWYSSTVEDYLAEYGRAEWDEIEEAMHNSIEVVAWIPIPKPYGGESE